MAAHRSRSCFLSLVKRGTVSFRKLCNLRSVLVPSGKNTVNFRRTISNTGARNKELLPHLSSTLAGHSYTELYELSVKNPETFWGSIAKERLTWTRPFDQVKDCDISKGRINWFLGGQLNVSGNKSIYSIGYMLFLTRLRNHSLCQNLTP